MSEVVHILDLFAGPGGWDEGLRLLNVDGVLGLEMDADACETARRAGFMREHVDIRRVDPMSYLGTVGLIASPPCQTFTDAGKGEGQASLGDLVTALALVANGATVDDAAVNCGLDTADPRSLLTLEPMRFISAWYDLVTGAIGQIARHYVPTHGQVYDIGASQGNVGRTLGPLLSDRKANLVSIEPSPDMCARFQGPGDLVCARAEEYGFEPFNFAVAMLALMFVPPAMVSDLLDRLVSNIQPGGALVVVERTLPPPGYMSVVTSRLTLAAKWEMGAAAERIIEKELSLSGVQRPIDVRLLTRHGAVEWFRFGDFAGYVIEGPA